MAEPQEHSGCLLASSCFQNKGLHIPLVERRKLGTHVQLPRKNDFISHLQSVRTSDRLQKPAECERERKQRLWDGFCPRGVKVPTSKALFSSSRLRPAMQLSHLLQDCRKRCFTFCTVALLTEVALELVRGMMVSFVVAAGTSGCGVA